MSDGTFRVTTEINFSYGHRLLDYNGKCAHPHGHNGRVEIELSANTLDVADMAVDFTDIKHKIQIWVDQHIDHKMVLRHDDPLLPALRQLDEPVYVMNANPTAESLAKLIANVALELGFPSPAFDSGNHQPHSQRIYLQKTQADELVHALRGMAAAVPTERLAES